MLSSLLWRVNMETFILRRVISKIEHKEVNAQNYHEAALLMEDFIQECIPDDCVIIRERCTIEYTGEVN